MGVALSDEAKLLARRCLSWLIDFSFIALLQAIFLGCAALFALDPQQQDKVLLMHICSAVTLIVLTVFLPAAGNGQTIGEHLCKITIHPKTGVRRKIWEIAIRELLCKVLLAPFIVSVLVIDYVVRLCLIQKTPHDELLLDYFLMTKVSG